MSVTMLGANFIEASALTPFSTSSSFVQASSPIQQPSKQPEDGAASLTCSNCHRRFVYKLNYAKHVTMCCKESTDNNIHNNNNMVTTSSNIVQYCNQCELQLVDAASVERHRLSHELVTKLSHSLQLTLTSSSPSPALEWFVGKIQFDFNDNGWGQTAVHRVDQMLTNCCLDDLLYLAKDSEFQPMVDVLLTDHHKQTTRRHDNGPLPSPKRAQLIETALVKPLVLQILSKEIKRMEPAKGQRNLPPTLVPVGPPPTSGQKQTPEKRPIPPSSIAGQANPPADEQQGPVADYSKGEAPANNSTTKYMCSECGACYNSAAVVFTHMCCQHPLSGTCVTGHSSAQPFRQTTLPFPPLVVDDLVEQSKQQIAEQPTPKATQQQDKPKRKKQKKQKAERSMADPLPPCSLLLQRKKRRRSTDGSSSRASKTAVNGQDFFLEHLVDLS